MTNSGVVNGMCALFLVGVVNSAGGQSLTLDGGIQYPDGTVQTTAASVPAPLPQTGNKWCRDASGLTVCSGPHAGQDGHLRMGVKWPIPYFTDNGDGTVTDNLTGLQWVKDASCFETVTWGLADEKVELLNDGTALCEEYTATHDDWRLPNFRELQSLQSLLLNDGHPFLNLESTATWSSTTVAGTFCGPGCPNTHAWSIAGYRDKSLQGNVWPVRDAPGAGTGDAALVLADGGIRFPGGSLQATAPGDPPAPVVRTGQTLCYSAAGYVIACAGTGQDGDLLRGVAWPDPRFTDHGDGTITDHLTGLMWQKDAECFGQITWLAALDVAVAFDNGDDFRCEQYVPGSKTGWRVPNHFELRSLIDYGRYAPALSPDHPFVDVKASSGLERYWSTTLRSGYARVIDIIVGTSWLDTLSNDVNYLWLVRGGQ